MLGDPASGIAKDAVRMGLVNQKPCVMAVLDVDDARQIANIAVHRVKALHYEQHMAVIAPRGAQPGLKVFQIVVGKDLAVELPASGANHY